AQTAVRTGVIALAADTMVALDDELLGKPDGRGEAEEMLRRLCGREHVVYTGMALASPDRVESGVDGTVVRMRSASDRELADYAATREPLDMAGAYAIQGRGAALVAGIEGDYFNVMGFPLGTFRTLLAAFGWRYAFGELSPAAADEATEDAAVDEATEDAAVGEDGEEAPVA
ncbi:MAG: Maf family protein, partial [Gemmatimonadota bacterium]|nr:Maf family protein [Gemmatimonadota bacterium]